MSGPARIGFLPYGYALYLVAGSATTIWRFGPIYAGLHRVCWRRQGLS